MADTIGLWSARADPVNTSHLITLLRLKEKNDVLKIVLLDYPERDFPISYCKAILEEFTSFISGFEVCVNTTHFGKITADELKEYDADTYYSGNLEVLKHIESLGCIACQYVERAYESNSTEIRLGSKVRSLLQ